MVSCLRALYAASPPVGVDKNTIRMIVRRSVQTCKEVGVSASVDSLEAQIMEKLRTEALQKGSGGGGGSPANASSTPVQKGTAARPVPVSSSSKEARPTRRAAAAAVPGGGGNMALEIQQQRNRLRPARERALRALPVPAPKKDGGGVFSEMQGSTLLLRSRLEARREEIAGDETLGNNTGQWQEDPTASWQ